MLNILFIFLSAHAAEPLQLKVDSPKFNYMLNINSKEMDFQSSTTKVKFHIKPCGTPPFEKLTSKIRYEIKTELTKSKKKTPNAILATLDQEENYLPPLSSAGIMVSKVETEVDYAISEANYRCSRK